MTTFTAALEALPQQAQQFIVRAYAELKKQPGFIAREGQQLLSCLVCRSLLEKQPLAAEAPTGTGKTIAYLIGILAAKDLFNGLPEPVVVATATKALQAQLMQSDLPKLVRAGCIGPHEFALAKGRSNYFCMRDAEDVMAVGGSILQEESEDETADPLAELDVNDVEQMLSDFKDGLWDGDFDTFLGNRPRSLIRIQVKSETCTGKKCEHYNQCALTRARARMADAKTIIANHDIVLADLQLAKDNDTGFFPAAKYMLVVDEAHNFPEKAIAVGQCEVDVPEVLMRIFRLRNLVATVSRHGQLSVVLNAPPVTGGVLEARDLLKHLQVLQDELDKVEVDEQSGQRRFSQGIVPATLHKAAFDVLTLMSPVEQAVASVLQSLTELPAPTNAVVRKSLAEATHMAVTATKVLKNLRQGLASFTGKNRMVRWVSKTDESQRIHTSPLLGAEVLKPLMWDTGRATPSFVSATLRDLDGFDRFRRGCGMPANSHYEVLPYIFPYGESTLTVAPMKATPKQAERVMYLQELRQKLPADINPKEGTLVLVPSRAMLREVAPMLQSRFGQDAVLVQGVDAIKKLLNTHMQRVASKRPSILVGMATMAEGLDLPGELCEHVVILALPFAVPTDPLEQELQELLGQRYFGERSLPDAMTKLLQMVGRLLRRESDRGRITVYDRRLASTSYGRRMLAALPPFKKVITPIAN